MNEAIVEADKAGVVIDDAAGVVRYPDGHEFTLSTSPDGYRYFTVGPVMARVHIQIHRLVAYRKFGEAVFAQGIVVRHRDGNPGNNDPENLLLGTPQDNALDRPLEDRIATAKHASRGRKRDPQPE